MSGVLLLAICSILQLCAGFGQMYWCTVERGLWAQLLYALLLIEVSYTSGENPGVLLLLVKVFLPLLENINMMYCTLYSVHYILT